MTTVHPLFQVICAQHFPALFEGATGSTPARAVSPAPSSPSRELPADRSDFARDDQSTGV